MNEPLACNSRYNTAYISTHVLPPQVSVQWCWLVYPKAGTDCKWLHSAVMEGATPSLSSSLTPEVVMCRLYTVAEQMLVGTTTFLLQKWRVTSSKKYGNLLCSYMLLFSLNIRYWVHVWNVWGAYMWGIIEEWIKSKQVLIERIPRVRVSVQAYVYVKLRAKHLL